MFLLPAAVGTFLLVNLLCACLALGVGFAAGVWFFGAKLAKPAPKSPAKKKVPSKAVEEAKRTTERAVMAATKVADLAQNVATDVGDHTAKMKAISADLAGIDRESGEANAAIFSAMDQMLAANSELQQRLENAEKQLAAQAAEIKAHESEARTDSLTGLSNRRAFDDEMKRRLAEWHRKNTPCTLVILDIDFFKKFNDTHGHQVGDEVLRQVAKVLAAQSREMDLPCRYGGEEFAVILPATDATKACKVAERIRAAIEESTTVCDGKQLKVTCSLGLSQMAADDDVAAVIRRADEALYTSKKAGRNCGHLHTGTKQVPITSRDLPAVEAAVPQPAALAEPAPESTAPSGTTFIQSLKRRVTESHRFGIPLCVLYLRMDEYELVNRKYGRQIACQMIETTSPVLSKLLREMDVLSRLENGEFVIMMPGSTQAEAGQVVKRMRSASDGCTMSLGDCELQIHLQTGLAELKPGETAQELLARARQSVTTSAQRPAVSE